MILLNLNYLHLLMLLRMVQHHHGAQIRVLSDICALYKSSSGSSISSSSVKRYHHYHNHLHRQLSNSSRHCPYHSVRAIPPFNGR